MTVNLAPPTIDPLGSPVAREDEFEDLTEVDELPALPPVEPAPSSSRLPPPPRKHRGASESEHPPPVEAPVSTEALAAIDAPTAMQTTPMQTGGAVEPSARTEGGPREPASSDNDITVALDPAEHEVTQQVPAQPTVDRVTQGALAPEAAEERAEKAAEAIPVAEDPRRATASDDREEATKEVGIARERTPAPSSTSVAPVRPRAAPEPGRSVVPRPYDVANKESSAAPVRDAAVADDVVAGVVPDATHTSLPAGKGRAPGAPMGKSALPVPSPRAAVDEERFSAESLPTRFDVGASERQASPWSDEQQKEALQNNARRLIAMFEEQLKGKADKQRQARLHYECARVYESPLADLQNAAKHYEAAVKLVPEHLPSVRGARRVELQLRRYQSALSSLDVEIRLCPEPARKALLMYEKGCLLEGRLSKKGEAREAFEQAADLAPNDPSILKATAHALEQALAWEPLVRTLERAANALAEFPSQRAAYLSQMARVVSVRLKDIPRAIELYKAAVQVDPRAPGALRSLSDLLYRSHRWAELVTVLEREASLTQDPESRSLAKYRVARLHVERLGNLEAAIAALEEAVSLAPRDETVLSELARLYEAAGKYPELATTLERSLSLQEQPRAEMYLRLAQLYDEKLQAPDRAIDRYGRSLALQPNYLPASLALERLRTQRGEWRELVEMLIHQADNTTDADERAALHHRIAELCEERLGSAEHAIAHHRRAIQCQPSFAAAYKSLVRLYSQAHAWHELIELYERRLEQDIARAERIATLFKIARLEEDALGTPATAVQTYQRILDIDPRHLEAIESLQRAAERGGRLSDLVAALEHEASIIEDKSAQLSLLYRAGEVLEGLGETERAIEKLVALLERDAKYGPAIKLLAKLYNKDGRWSALLATYQRELGITADGAEKSSLLFKMGELCEFSIGDSEQAIAHYKRATQMDASNLLALRALRRVLTATEQFKEVVQLLELEVKRTTDKRQAARLWFFAGELYENRLEQIEKALDCYLRALDQQPDYRPAIDASTRLLEQKNSFNDLRDRLRTEADVSTDPMLAIEAQYREGELLRDNLKQLPQAAEAFEALAKREPGHAGALLSLERIYVQLDDRQKLARLYEAQSNTFDGAPARVAAYRAWIQLLSNEDAAATEGAETSRSEAVKNAHLAVLSLQPNDEHTLLQLEGTALQLNDVPLIHQIDQKLSVSNLDRHSIAAYQTRLAEALEARGDGAALELYRVALRHDAENLAAAAGIARIAERTQNPDLLAEASELEADLLGRPTEGARLLLLAAHKISAAGQREVAAERLKRALELDPQSLEAADALIQVMAGQGQDAALVDSLSRAATSAKRPEVKASLWVRVSRLQHSVLSDNGAAIASVQRAVREQPDNAELYMQLAEYHLSGRNWKDAVTQLQELLKHRPEPRLRLRALIELGSTLAERLNRPAQAEGHVKAAIEIDANNRVALALLLRVQMAQGEDDAAATAARLVSAAKDPAERAEALTHLGRLEAAHGRDSQAVDAFFEAVSILGPASSAAADFKDWLTKKGQSANWQPYADALSRFLARASDPAAQKAALADLGAVLDDRLKQHEAGIDALTRALSLDPADLELRTDLARRQMRAGQLEAAAKHYHVLASSQPGVAAHWRSLSSCYERLMRMEEARWVIGPLIFSGEASPQEVRRYRETPPRPGAIAAGALSIEALSVLEQAAPVGGPVQELLAAMAPALPKLYPPPFDSYGVNKNDRVTNKTNNSLRHVADRVALIFGVESFELYVHQSKRSGVAVELSDEPALFVNANVSALNEAEQVFVFALPFANIARGLHYLDRLGAAELGALLTAAARTQSPSFGDKFGDPKTLDAIGRRITKAMPWFSGGKLETAAATYATARVDFAAWVENVQVSSASAALLASDDLAGGLALLRRAGLPDRALQRVLSFAVGDAAANLRRKMFGG